MNNYLTNYDDCIRQLSEVPNSLMLQYQAVLSLARAGSLSFAWTEFQRYGLDKISNLPDDKVSEDVMALGGRLFKDLYLCHSGKAARDYALKSAEKYEAAFQVTGGFYSGINSATMGFLGGIPKSIIAARAETLLRELPSYNELDKEKLYFIEATRAEAFLILGQTYNARQAFQIAINLDPRNYTAHATTLKQFDMILSHQGENKDWLSAFMPPKPIHFAGHLFELSENVNKVTLSFSAYDQLKINISDALQFHDIGFGYGALAAGSDIAIAEVLLDEGCELHVTLPVEKNLFVEHSVKPYGIQWVSRFNTCWERAQSQTIVTQDMPWPNHGVDRFSNTVAMGQAVLRAKDYAVAPLQLLIWDEKGDGLGTARNADDWRASGHMQIVLPYPNARKHKPKRVSEPEIKPIVSLFVNDTGILFEFNEIDKAIKKAFDLQKKFRIGIDTAMVSEGASSSVRVKQFAYSAAPGGVVVSESVASYLLLYYDSEYLIEYLGLIEEPVEKGENPMRAFAVTHKR